MSEKSSNTVTGLPDQDAGGPRTNVSPTPFTGTAPVLEEAFRAESRVVGEDEVIPLVEEHLSVEKREFARKVRIRTTVDTVEEMARATLEGETVEVTRVPVDRIVEQAPAVRTENDVMIIPVMEEIMVVEKRLVLKEELHIRRRVETETFEQPVTLRKQRAVVERDEDGTTAVEVERHVELKDGTRTP